MIQVTKCKCGKIFAACAEPNCYTDAEYQREVRKDIKRGCTVEMVASGTWSFEECTCEKTTTQIDKNQLSLF
jgi:hypothetical protein